MEYASLPTDTPYLESAARPVFTVGLRHRLDTLDGQRAEALARDDQSTVAQCEDALIRAELFSSRMEVWWAQQVARTESHRA